MSLNFKNLCFSRVRFLVYFVIIWAGLALCAEGVLRLAGIRPPTMELRGEWNMYRPDRDLIWALKKGFSGLQFNGQPVATNSLGLRGAEVLPTSEDQRLRILFLGDSVTFGWGLAQGQTIPDLVQAHLSTNRLGDRPIEAINAGVPGYSTFQSEVFFREHGRLLQPDHVVLGFCLNDVVQRYYHLIGYGGTRYFAQTVDTSVGLSWPRRLWYSTALREALISLLRNSAERAENYSITKLSTDPTAPHIVEAWQVVFAEIDRLAADIASSGSKFTVVIFPYARQVAGKFNDQPQRTLGAYLNERGIPYLDTLSVQQRSGVETEELFLDKGHPSQRGAEVIAHSVADFLAIEKQLEIEPGD